ncbi:DNA primase [Ligilactobacillus ceti]|uniref:DNA primase n=1 Tax=Ligilactobacillus ceti DSM 22408 TaxID=1122146 RepID=A0A0R2KHL1_9LACO|nr:DNA primase [Ligilactobacillus ceti]KRN88857.1 DNA primase [Ligilactobacillus ceti DSM 22408]
MSRRIPEEVIDSIRSSVNVLDIVGQYVELHRSGKNWFGLCPFHPEKTPSFSVNEQKQIFNCFSCHRGGNVFKFIMEIEGLSFPEAVLKVAELGNIPVDEQYQNQATQQVGGETSSENGQITAMYQVANELYHHILVNTQIGEQALAYLHQRGLNDDMIAEFQLGYAPPKAVLQAVLKEKNKNLDYQILRKSGLFSVYEDGSLNDRFKDRVMFPIRNATGKIVAFSGRSLANDPNTPKYLNSPETTIFNKRKILFNFDKAKGAIRREKKCLLFEGFMDVLAAYSAGVKNSVASMGTSLTDEQIYLLQQNTKNIDLCYDGDLPGQKATKRALEILTPQNKFNLRVIALPDKMDPDEYLQKYGAEKFRTLINDSHETPLAFYMHFYEQGRNMDNEADQLDYLSDVLAEIAKLNDPLEQNLYLNKLAERLQLDKYYLEEKLKTLRQQYLQQKQKEVQTNYLPPSQQRSTKLATETHQLSKVERAERLLLYRMLHNYTVRGQVSQIPDFSFIHDNYQSIYTLTEGYFNAYQNYDSASFLDYINNEHLQQVIIALEMANYAEEVSPEEVNDCLHVIMKTTPLEQQIKDLQMQLQQATRVNNTNLITKLTIDLVNLLKKKQIDNSDI